MFSWEKPAHRMKFWPLKPKIKAHGGTVWEQLISWASSRQFQDFLLTGECVCLCEWERESKGGKERACMSVWQQAVPTHFFLTFPSVTLCLVTVEKNPNYISLNNSCRESSCYQVHTCPTKSSKWKLTIAMWQRISFGNCFQCSLCRCIVKVRSYAETDKGVFILYLFFILFDLFLSIIGQGTRITHPLHICYSVFFLTTCWKVVQSPSVFVKLHLLREFV